MFRKLLCALTVLVLCVGVAGTGEIRGVITKVDGDQITFAAYKDKDGSEKGPAKTLPATGAKVVRGKYNKDTKQLEAGDPLEGGLKNEVFSMIGMKGIYATIVTKADNQIIEIRVLVFPKGFPKR
jgi:hypothetical protein